MSVGILVEGIAELRQLGVTNVVEYLMVELETFRDALRNVSRNVSRISLLQAGSEYKYCVGIYRRFAKTFETSRNVSKTSRNVSKSANRAKFYVEDIRNPT